MIQIIGYNCVAFSFKKNKTKPTFLPLTKPGTNPMMMMMMGHHNPTMMPPSQLQPGQMLMPPGQMPPMMMGVDMGFDGKMLRKSMARKTVDYHPSVVNYFEERVWKKDARDTRALQADPLYTSMMTLPQDMLDNPASCVMNKFIRAALNKDPRPVFCVCVS